MHKSSEMLHFANSMIVTNMGLLDDLWLWHITCNAHSWDRGFVTIVSLAFVTQPLCSSLVEQCDQRRFETRLLVSSSTPLPILGAEKLRHGISTSKVDWPYYSLPTSSHILLQCQPTKLYLSQQRTLLLQTPLEPWRWPLNSSPLWTDAWGNRLKNSTSKILDTDE